MAWYTHQILADYLNRIENHTLIGKVLDDILAEDVVLTYGTQTYSGKAAVLGFFEDTSHAISSEFGFRATPVIICNTDDPEYNLSSDKLHTAVALLSKLETYVSWYFLLRGNEEFLINRIYGTRGEGYSFYPDVYSEGNFDYSGYLNNHHRAASILRGTALRKVISKGYTTHAKIIRTWFSWRETGSDYLFSLGIVTKQFPV